MSQDPKDSVKAINAFAWRVLRRLAAAGDHSTSLEDIKQELWIAWCIADKGYDPECGTSFITYLTNGMRLYINRHIEKTVDRRHDEVTALSLDYKTEAGDWSDIIPSNQPGPNVEVERKSQLEFAMTKLSPRAQLFVRLLEQQPVELLNEVKRIEQRSEYAKQRGIPSFSSNRLTSTMIFDLLGASRNERNNINRELRKLGSRVQRMV